MPNALQLLQHGDSACQEINDTQELRYIVSGDQHRPIRQITVKVSQQSRLASYSWMKTEHGSWELELIWDLKSNLIKLLHRNKAVSFKVYFEVMGCIRIKARTFHSSTYKKLFFVRMWSILSKIAVLPLEYYMFCTHTHGQHTSTS